MDKKVALLRRTLVLPALYAATPPSGQLFSLNDANNFVRKILPIAEDFLILSMKEITVKVPEEQLGFFNQLIEQLGFVEKKKVSQKKRSDKQRILKGIEKGLKQVKLVKEGKLKARPLKNFLNEL